MKTPKSSQHTNENTKIFTTKSISTGLKGVSLIERCSLFGVSILKGPSLSLSLCLQVQYILHGAWDKGMTRKSRDGTGVKEMWRANEQVPNWERQYGFTQFAMTLNETEESMLGLAHQPTAPTTED